MQKRWLKRIPAVLLSTFVLTCSFGFAHDFPLHTVTNSFVKIEDHQAHLVVRVPLDMLHSVQFPVNGREYDLQASGPALQNALNGIAADISIWENGVRLVPAAATGRLSLPSDRSFEDYARAMAIASAPMDLNSAIYFDQGYLDAHFTYPIQSPDSVFTIQTILAQDIGDYSKLTVRFMPLNASSRAFIISTTSGRVALNPPWYQAAKGFVVLGVNHILSGLDHLLFLLCLVIPIRRLRVLIPVVTAFTVGHSATLIGTAYNLAPSGAWFPPFVETAIALSILYMAVENIVGANLNRRWLIAGLFGLVHGFGFSYALKESLQFAGSHLLVSLLAFNIGIEIGQLLVLTAMVAVLWWSFHQMRHPRTAAVVLSAFVAHTAWHWMIERGSVLWQSPWPQVDTWSIMVLSRWIAALLLAAGAGKVLFNYAKNRKPQIATISSSSVEPAVEKPAA